MTALKEFFKILAIPCVLACAILSLVAVGVSVCIFLLYAGYYIAELLTTLWG